MTKRGSHLKTLASCVLACVLGACEGPAGIDGTDGTDGVNGTNGTNGTNGADGEDGTSCTVTSNGDGTKTISCTDGTSAVVADGQDGTNGTNGTDGTSCTVVDNGDGTKTISCDDGTEVTITDGRPGLAEGTSLGLVADVQVSAPAAGGYFTAGERIEVTITLTDSFGFPVELADLSRANLYMYGPGGVLSTTTSVGLLGATADRASATHHYINLKTSTSPNLVVDGNVLTYTLEPVTAAEVTAAGTYTISLWAVRADNGYDQLLEMADVQIGTVTPVDPIVGGCADCHRGTNGKTYLAHIDPGYSPTGNWALDFEPVRSCKNCHNQEGYAAYSKCSDGSRPTGSTCPEGTTLVKVPDPIVRRVHGVHRGKGLKSAFNTDPNVGDFKDYTGVIFPADIKRCDKCHLDTSWQTNPSRLACGSCHDNLDFTTGDFIPAKQYATLACTAATVDTDCVSITPASARACSAATGTGVCVRTEHTGGSATTDATCAGCHGATTGLKPIVAAHAIAAPVYANSIEVTLSPPTSGTYYTTESPTVTVTVKNAAGAAVDPNTITEAAFNGLRLFVHGPRSLRKPVLTTAARGIATSRASLQNGNNGPWNLTGVVDLNVTIDGVAVNVPVTAGAFPTVTAATPAQVAAWLNANTSFAAVATASSTNTSTSKKVTIKSDTIGASSTVLVTASTSGTNLGTVMAWPATVGLATPSSYASNDLRVRTDPADIDPKITRDSTSIRYALDSVSTLAPGTYILFVYGKAASADPTVRQLIPFQVKTATVDPKIATNCANCHEDTLMHGGLGTFDVDYCGNCHDYERQFRARTAIDTFVDGWGGAAASGRSNMGFGAGPISRRVHGVHFMAYLDKRNQIHSSYANGDIIFPQDVRNCGTCHSETSTWAEKPSRLACNACHDSDSALSHAWLNTYDPTPVDNWSGDEMESCEVCHGGDREYAPDVVHNISSPYRAPYPREAE